MILGTGCHKNNFEVRNVDDLNVKTFFNAENNIEVIILSGEKTQFVVIPKEKIRLKNQMSDEEYRCLKNCIPIEDLNKKWNCILKCPVTKQYSVFAI